MPATHRPPARLNPLSWFVCTDGACAPTNPGPSGWGAVVVEPGGSAGTDHYGFIGDGTNQIAELTAAIEGLLLVPAGASVDLVSDSQYTLNGMTVWRAGWEKSNFRNAKKQPIANLELWRRLWAAADARIVTTRWVKGHDGDHYNERADVLANKALSTRGRSGSLQ